MSKRRQFFLWILAAILGASALAAVLMEEHRVPPRKQASYLIGVPEEGAALFFGEKHCSKCHAVNGTGGASAPDLGAIRPGKPAMGWIASVLWNHAPRMWERMGETPPRIDQQEMAHLLAFLHNAGTGDRPGNPADGKRLFGEKGCGHCHSRVAAPQDDIDWERAMWDHAQSRSESIKAAAAGEWPEFIGEEMNDLMAYVAPSARSARSLRGSAEHGWEVFQSKCLRCHSVGGNGGRVGPELGPDYDLPHSSAQFAAVLWNHAPSMLKHARERSISLPKLEGRELRDIQAFLISLQYFEPRGSRFVGQRVFADRGCARCHGARAQGTSDGPALRTGADAFTTVSLASALWSHGPEMWSRASHRGIAWPMLESADIGHLISFLNDPIRQN